MSAQLYRLILTVFLLCGVSCGRRPILGEIVVESVDHAGFRILEPGQDPGDVRLLMSSGFWRDRIGPLLVDRSPAVQDFLRSREKAFIVSLGKLQNNPHSPLTYALSIEFHGISRTEAEFVLQSVSQAYVKYAGERLARVRQDMIIFLENEIARRREALSHQNPNSRDAQVAASIVVHLEKNAADAIAQKPLFRIISSRILD